MTTTLVITAAYVWQCATDFRANNNIADTIGLNVSEHNITVVDVIGDLASVVVAASMLDDAAYVSQPYSAGRHIVAARGTYRGVDVTVQGMFPNPDIALAALRAGGR